MEAKTFSSVLSTFNQVDLAGLDEVRLLNRIDTKYVFHISKLQEILEEVQPYYDILEIGSNRIFKYESLYFDTDDFQLYKFHHNGKLNRLKVRYRKYSDSGLVFFEAKYKVKGDRTEKLRLRQAEIKLNLTPEEFSIVNHPQVESSLLKKKLWIYFNRITFASKQRNERLTLDTSVVFDNNRSKCSYPELVIAEIKTEKSSYRSPMVRALKNRHLEEIGFSKYAMAVANLEDIKSNAFKPNLIKIKKIIANG